MIVSKSGVNNEEIHKWP